jgi:DNA-binding CsgD family transcriptional regulator
MPKPDTPRCDRLCDEAWAAIAAELQLTPHEAQIARHLVDGGEVRTLAQMLGLSPQTLRTEIRRLYGKTGARRRERFSAKVFAFYRNWRSMAPPNHCQ